MWKVRTWLEEKKQRLNYVYSFLNVYSRKSALLSTRHGKAIFLFMFLCIKQFSRSQILEKWKFSWRDRERNTINATYTLQNALEKWNIYKLKNLSLLISSTWAKEDFSHFQDNTLWRWRKVLFQCCAVVKLVKRVSDRNCYLDR